MIIGIDPGKGGGIAFYEIAKGMRAYPMPKTPKDVVDLVAAHVKEMTSPNDHVHAFLEQVSASPQMGVVSAFTFGRGYGNLEMMLIALRINLHRVLPIKWQTYFSCRTGGDKNITKRKAQELFPHHKVTHGIADAMLICTYGRIVRGYGEQV